MDHGPYLSLVAGSSTPTCIKVIVRELRVWVGSFVTMPDRLSLLDARRCCQIGVSNTWKPYVIKELFDIITRFDFGSIPLVFVELDCAELTNVINMVGVDLSELSCFILDVKALVMCKLELF